MVKEWVEFNPSHAKDIIKNNHRPQEDWMEPDFVDKWAKAWEGKIKAWTLLVDGLPVACFGITLQEWKKSEAWALFANDFEKHKLTIYRLIKAALDLAFHQNIVRIQATIDAGCPVNIRWIESLGFEYEGRLRKWGERGQDYLLYSRVA